MDKVKHKEFFLQYVGRYINICCKIEHSCHLFLIEHYVEHNDRTNQFIRDFLSRKSMGFYAAMKNVMNVLSDDPEYSSSFKKELHNSKSVNRIVKNRDIFAHSHLNGFKEESFKLLWFNSDHEKNNYAIRYSYEQLEEELTFIKDFSNSITDIVRPILENRYK